MRESQLLEREEEGKVPYVIHFVGCIANQHKERRRSSATDTSSSVSTMAPTPVGAADISAADHPPGVLLPVLLLGSYLHTILLHIIQNQSVGSLLTRGAHEQFCGIAFM